MNTLCGNCKHSILTNAERAELRLVNKAPYIVECLLADGSLPKNWTLEEETDFLTRNKCTYFEPCPEKT